ncbi:MAG: hypothetical protein K0S58_2166 [Nitrospira sp.]|nr:hypothetical protein [Nitrospira sp.]
MESVMSIDVGRVAKEIKQRGREFFLNGSPLVQQLPCLRRIQVIPLAILWP